MFMECLLGPGTVFSMVWASLSSVLTGTFCQHSNLQRGGLSSEGLSNFHRVTQPESGGS